MDMTNIYWTLNAFGDQYPPENADEIIDAANALLDLYAETHDEDETEAFSERLWDHYCMTGQVEDPTGVNYMHYPVGDPF